MCRNVFVCFSSKLSCTWTLHSPFLPPAWDQNRRRLESRAESCLRNRNAGKLLSSSRADKSRSVWSGRSPALISPTQRSLSRSICPELTSHSWTLISSPTTHSSSSAKQHLRQHNSPENLLRNINQPLIKHLRSKPSFNPKSFFLSNGQVMDNYM